ncbi:hypothetical protein BGZ60DRAFT_407788 [Tricladium varicosporioides]|nr:hypothetical protein BGZ60DRAFT_407788 [Hymenoscyphus varicosporioides]
MKYILTGVTGFIGEEVLHQCRQNPSITSIIALTRRPLPEEISADPKVEVIIMKDFKTYTPEVLEKLKGADACIWSMGHVAAVPEVEIDYPLAFMNAFAPTVQKRFRYMHCSGRLAEKDQEKSLVFLQEGRRIKGTAELEVMAFEKKKELHNGLWESYIVKPSMVLKKEGQEGYLKWVGSFVIGGVYVDELAAAMIDIATNGSDMQIELNAEVVARGRKVLDAHKL